VVLAVRRNGHPTVGPDTDCKHRRQPSASTARGGLASE
jgi:hypothetical protein